MDISGSFKIPVERIVYFVAAVIPGAVAILIYQSVTKTTIQWLFNIGFWGYRTKLGLLIVAAFVIGHTLTNLVRGVIDDLAPILAEWVARIPWPTKASFEHEAAPWRSTEWRNAVKARLGPSAPQDLKLMTLEMMKQATSFATSLPPDQQASELSRIVQERTSSALNDMEWSNLYSHYHFQVTQLHEHASRDEITVFIRDGFTYNFLAAALYVLASAVVVPAVRQWWCMLPAAAWLLAFAMYMVAVARRTFANKWSTLHDQISYLSSGHI